MTDHLTTIGLQIIPKSKALHTYDLVDEAIEVIQASGLKHQITPFETVMEGKYEDIMTVCDRAQKAVLAAGAEECLVYFRIHYRKDADVTFEEKRLDR
ncbi:thiamine-binding protein [Marinoscillum sp.]|uniref:thiamine-binding protein n=1 Tax=Marinoscillum sp. TaxID=2024838 RepID=UPI003BAAFBA9